jgi:hypothetical protein
LTFGKKRSTILCKGLLSTAKGKIKKNKIDKIWV